MTSRLAVGIVLMLWIGVLSDRQQFSAQSPERSGPPVPYEDVGACPFEGCVYRDWVANDTIMVRRERRAGAPVVFSLKKGERVRAITGVVVTIKAGRVQFREPVDLFSTSGALHIEPGQTLYLLTYHGEGSTTAWFQGRLYEDVDGSTAFFNGICADDPSRCVGKILERSQSVWWVQIRNARGQIGWTDQPSKFGNKDALGAFWLLPSVATVRSTEEGSRVLRPNTYQPSLRQGRRSSPSGRRHPAYWQSVGAGGGLNEYQRAAPGGRRPVDERPRVSASALGQL